MQSRLKFAALALSRYLLLACLASSACRSSTAATPTPTGSREGGIEGVFVSAYYESNHGTGYRFFLRFYEDGLVLSASIDAMNAAAAWSTVRSWFHRDNPDLSRGRYHLLNDRIWFSTTGSGVTVDYAGTYSPTTLLLDTFSHYTDWRSTNVEFARLEADPQE